MIDKRNVISDLYIEKNLKEFNFFPKFKNDSEDLKDLFLKKKRLFEEEKNQITFT